MIKKIASISPESAQAYIKQKSDIGIINLITPSVIGMAFRRMFGLTIIGWSIDILLRLVGVDFNGIIESCCSAVFAEFKSSGEKITPQKVDDVVSQEIDKKLSVIKQSNYSPIILKIAAATSAPAKLAGSSGIIANFLKSSISFLFKLSFASVGMELFSDFILASSGGKGDLNIFEFFSMKRTPKQTKFQPNKSIQEINFSQAGWRVDQSMTGRLGSIPPVKLEQIKDTLKDWAVEAYPTIDLEALNKSQELFNLAEKIYYNNSSIINLVNYFFIPKDFTSKMDIVNYFIDDVASISKIEAPSKAEAPKEEKKVN